MSNKDIGIKFGGHIGMSKYDIMNAYKSGRLVQDIINLSTSDILKIITRDSLWEIRDDKDSVNVGAFWLRSMLSKTLSKKLLNKCTTNDTITLYVVVVHKYLLGFIRDSLYSMLGSDGLLDSSAVDKLEKLVNYLTMCYKDINTCKASLDECIQSVDDFDSETKDMLKFMLGEDIGQSLLSSVIVDIGYGNLIGLLSILQSDGVASANIVLKVMQEYISSDGIGYSNKLNGLVLIYRPKMYSDKVFYGNIQRKHSSFTVCVSDVKVNSIGNLGGLLESGELYSKVKEFIGSSILGLGNSSKRSSVSKTRGKALDSLTGAESSFESLKSTRNFDSGISTDRILKDYGLYGGEFGNWNSQKERQNCLDLGYNALSDLAYILGIDKSLMGLPNKGMNRALSLAFGARGRGGAKAHYETGLNVINLTKMSGAGSLAHEYGHALDRWLGLRLYGTPTLFTRESSARRTSSICSIVDDKELGELWYLIKLRYLNSNTNVLEERIKLLGVYSEKFSRLGLTNDEIEDLKELLNTYAGTVEHYLSMFKGAWLSLHIRVVDNRDLRIKVTDLYKELVEQYIALGEVDLKPTSCYELASKTSKANYYLSDVEIFARLFNRYIYEELKSRGYKSSYLCGYTCLEPTADEWVNIESLFKEYIGKVVGLLKGSTSNVMVSKVESNKTANKIDSIVDSKSLRLYLRDKYRGVIDSDSLLRVYKNILRRHNQLSKDDDIVSVVNKISRGISNKRSLQEAISFISFKILGIDKRSYLIDKQYDKLISDRDMLKLYLDNIDKGFMALVKLSQDS